MNLVLCSERLTLAPFDASDLPLAIEMFTDPDVRQYAGGVMTEDEIHGHMSDGDIEIGYFLKQSAWGKGYATEACKRLLQMVFEETPLNEVVATFEGGNTASRHVLKKAGFLDQGMRRCYGEDGPDYRITRDGWTHRQQSS